MRERQRVPPVAGEGEGAEGAGPGPVPPVRPSVVARPSVALRPEGEVPMLRVRSRSRSRAVEPVVELPLRMSCCGCVDGVAPLVAEGGAVPPERPSVTLRWLLPLPEVDWAWTIGAAASAAAAAAMSRDCRFMVRLLMGCAYRA